MHAHTLYGAIRPFGVSVILASYEHDQPKLYAIEPSGVSYVSAFVKKEIWFLTYLFGNKVYIGLNFIFRKGLQHNRNR